MGAHQSLRFSYIDESRINQKVKVESGLPPIWTRSGRKTGEPELFRRSHVEVADFDFRHFVEEKQRFEDNSFRIRK